MHIREAGVLKSGYVYRGIEMIILDDKFLAILHKPVVHRSAISKFAADCFYKAVLPGIFKSTRVQIGRAHV